MTQREDQSAFRIASAIPGRVRLQFVRGSGEALLYACERGLSALESVQRTRVAPGAASIIVEYDRRRHPLEDFLEVLTSLVAREAASTGRRPTAAPVRRPGERTVGDAPLRGSLPPARLLRAAGSVAGKRMEALIRRVPGQTEVIHSMNLANDRPAGLKPLLISTAAVVCAAVEAVPLAITGMVLALAVIPIAQRAAKGLGKRQLTVDQLDMANILLVAFGGQVLVAGVVAWLVSLTEVLRGKAVGYSRQSIARLMPPGEKPLSPEFQRAIERIYQAELSNSRFQDEAVRIGNATAYPLFVLALLMFVLTRDITMVISILKPRTDYTAGLRFGISTPILNALIAARRQGPLITSGAALEKLTLLEVVLVTRGVENKHARMLGRLEEALGARGIRLLPMDGLPNTPAESAVERLKAEGVTVGLLGVSGDLPMDGRADVRILLGASGDLEIEQADVFLMESGLPGLIAALDIAWQSARVCKQNTGLYGGAALTNLTTVLLGLSPPALSSVINAVTMATAGGNALRLLPKAPKQPRDPRRLRDVLRAAEAGE